MIKYNKNIQKFIIDNNINIKYFQANKEAILFNKCDINPIIARWGIYIRGKQVEVSIANKNGILVHILPLNRR